MIQQQTKHLIYDILAQNDINTRFFFQGLFKSQLKQPHFIEKKHKDGCKHELNALE